MKITSRKLSFSVLMLTFVLFALAVNSFAQDLDDVSISGKITDTNGAAIVGATVTATQIETGAERTFVSNEDGRYRIIDLKPGTYTVKVTMQSFETQIKTDLATISGQNVQLDFALPPAGVTAEQTVTLGGDDAPAVDTTRTMVVT